MYLFNNNVPASLIHSTPKQTSVQPISGSNWKIMIGSLLYIFGPRERQSKPSKEMYIPLRPIPKEDSL